MPPPLTNCTQTVAACWCFPLQASDLKNTCGPHAKVSGYSTRSSYDVMDHLFTAIAQHHTFPNLKTLVLLGHSDGGQALQRYTVRPPLRRAVRPCPPHSRFYGGRFNLLGRVLRLSRPKW